MAEKAPANKKIKVLSLAAIIFLTVSGGPYGLEPLLSYVGGKGALLLLIITPLLWDVPVILTVMELNSMMPVTGGYYQWVKKALGLRWAFYEGWWTWLYTFVDLALYPQLFITYAILFFPQIAVYKIPICLCFIWGCTFLNIRGIVPVGKVSAIISIAVLVPFILLFGKSFISAPAGVANQHYIPATPMIGMALFTVMWNFIGWDNATTYAGEVNQPIRTYLKATGIAFITIILLYLATITASIYSGIDVNVLKDTGFSAVAVKLSSNWLGVFIAAAGMVSALGLFSAVLLSVSRVPEVMAEDKLLPSGLHKLHPKYKTPYISIILCAIVVSGMVFLTFGELLIIDISIYFCGLLLEFISLVAMRIKHPSLPRPFKIPMNITGICLLLLLPVAVFFIALINIIMQSGNSKPVLITLLLLVSAEVVWRIMTWRRDRALIQKD